MANLKINIDAVRSVAGKIKSVNGDMRDEFNDLQSAISRLNSNWDGSASNNAINKFHELRNNYNNARYSVMDNYVKFLYEQIGEGYTQTEETNKKLAEAFK